MKHKGHSRSGAEARNTGSTPGDTVSSAEHLCCRRWPLQTCFPAAQGNHAPDFSQCIHLGNDRANRNTRSPLFSPSRPRAGSLVSRLGLCQHAREVCQVLVDRFVLEQEQTLTKAVCSRAGCIMHDIHLLICISFPC